MSDCIAGRSSDAPMPPMIAQKMMTGTIVWANIIAIAPIA